MWTFFEIVIVFVEEVIIFGGITQSVFHLLILIIYLNGETRSKLVKRAREAWMGVLY